MRIGIDASNLRTGGGITHLVELLRAADPGSHGITQLVVWGGRATLDRLDDQPWLVKQWLPTLDGHLLARARSESLKRCQ
jgi:hypothetical protein